MAFKTYVTDCLRLLTENTANTARGGKYIKVRFADVIQPENKKTETRTSDEIIAGLKEKFAKYQAEGGERE